MRHQTQKNPENRNLTKKLLFAVLLVLVCAAIFVILLYHQKHTAVSANSTVTEQTLPIQSAVTPEQTTTTSPSAVQPATTQPTTTLPTTVQPTTAHPTTTAPVTTRPTTTQPATTAVQPTTMDSAEEPVDSRINWNASHPFLIRINRAAGTTTVYGMDLNGNYTVPYKAFCCSVGNPITKTPLGEFKTGDMYPWRLMVDGSYAQYAIRIHGQILLHSVCYHSQDPSDLKYEDFNKLGTPRSLGCIRFACGDIKWIYDHCPAGTTVIIYDDAANPGPLGKPKQVTIDSNSPYRGWDPTDPNEKNPWRKEK